MTAKKPDVSHSVVAPASPGGKRLVDIAREARQEPGKATRKLPPPPQRGPAGKPPDATEIWPPVKRDSTR